MGRDSGILIRSSNNCFEADGWPFRFAAGQAAPQAQRYA